MQNMMVIKEDFFDKKSKGSGVNTKLAPQNQQLAQELNKPIIKKKLKKKKTCSI